MRGTEAIAVHDVIQLDPETSGWGPLLCVVSDVRAKYVQCYALVPERRGEPPGAMYMNVAYGTFTRVGRAEYALPDAGE